jgi:hypothetical protein
MPTSNLVPYLDHISTLACSQRQVDAICFDLSSAFDFVSHTLLLQRLRTHGLSDSYNIWLHSYITKRYSVVRIHGIYSIPFEVISGVLQGSSVWPLLFNVFVTDLCNVIKHSRHLLFADEIKIYCTVSCETDCTLLQSDIGSVCGWCTANCMKLKYDKIKVPTFTRKTNAINLLKPSGNFTYRQV